MKTLYIRDFTEFPGPRFMRLGPNSGEEFRDNILIPELLSHEDAISVNLDNTMGYGSSFLEEAFGGLVRKGIDHKKIEILVKNLQATDDPSLISEIKSYIDDALGQRN